MRYVDTISLNPTGSQTAASYYFRANDVYDPDFSSTGHQPYGFDQWAPMYERIHVIGSKCTVRYTPTATSSSNIAAMLSLTCDDNTRSSVTYPSYSAFMEKAPGKKVMVGQHYTNGSFFQDKQRVTASFSPRKLYNTNIKSYISDTTYACSYTASVADANTAWYNINLIDIDGSNPDAMTFTVIIDYICVLSGRLTVATS